MVASPLRRYLPGVKFLISTRACVCASYVNIYMFYFLIYYTQVTTYKEWEGRRTVACHSKLVNNSPSVSSAGDGVFTFCTIVVSAKTNFSPHCTESRSYTMHFTPEILIPFDIIITVHLKNRSYILRDFLQFCLVLCRCFCSPS